MNFATYAYLIHFDGQEEEQEGVECRGRWGAKKPSDGRSKGMKRIETLFTAMQEKGAAWYGREREGIALIEGFQSALLAVREAQVAVAVGIDTVQKGKQDSMVLSGLAGSAEMDPWLAEDLYQQMQELSGGFEELLEEMYTLQTEARDIVLNMSDEEERQFVATELRPVEYLQMMSQELATFEAEYQHIEALLQLISFETSTDELRTLVISWSTSPFLDPHRRATSSRYSHFFSLSLLHASHPSAHSRFLPVSIATPALPTAARITTQNTTATAPNRQAHTRVHR
ncbi:hypothetical protein GQ600_8596 [Phytophthora cactorum]|nr:hypothetical protein GQ600_8596 [Phytophthora cactorum]